MSADGRVIGALLWLAKNDLEDAELLRGRRNAAYHLEQAAEKLIKAVLTSENKHAGVGHRLSDLIEELPDLHPWKHTLKELTVLEAYATTFRYGTPSGRIQAPMPELEEANLMQAVRGAIERAVVHFEVDLTTKNPSARRPDPIR